jgi:hypothetical protein
MARLALVYHDKQELIFIIIGGQGDCWRSKLD